MARVKKHTFDDLNEQKRSMNIQEVFSFLNDYEIVKNFTVKRDFVRKIIAQINLRTKPKDYKTPGELDIDGFTEFIL